MFLWKFLRHKFLMFVWIWAALLPGLGLSWVSDHHPRLFPSWLTWVIIPLYLLYCACSYYVFATTSRYLDEDLALSFWTALKRSFGALRVMLAFVPVIGLLFQPDEDKTRYDPDDD